MLTAFYFSCYNIRLYEFVSVIAPEDKLVPACDTTWRRRKVLTFQRNVLPRSWGRLSWRRNQQFLPKLWYEFARLRFVTPLDTLTISKYASYICVVPVIDLGATMGDQRHGPAVSPSIKRHGIHCTEGRVGSRVGLDGCGKSRHHPDSILRSSSP